VEGGCRRRKKMERERGLKIEAEGAIRSGKRGGVGDEGLWRVKEGKGEGH